MWCTHAMPCFLSFVWCYTHMVLAVNRRSMAGQLGKRIDWCRQLADDILQCAAGLQSMGLRSGEAVSLFSENGARWLVVDQAIMRLAAVDAVGPPCLPTALINP